MAPIIEQAEEKRAVRSKNYVYEVVGASLLGPAGVVMLFVKKDINKWQFAGLLCMWFSVIWCRYLTGMIFPSTYYEIFTIGMLSYGGVILNPVKSESNIVSAISVPILMFSAAFIGYADICAMRRINNLVSPIDLTVIGIGYVGYLQSSYLAWKKRPHEL